ncbi:MAG: phosphate acetyltransferase [Alphaproteobacteria bacterium]|nr:phosphate acetyltransferase [Alphaproteobacteria bacterium]MDE2629520.1 phosphate acetyltransferase [Alphaproteobacteria bacterium]
MSGLEIGAAAEISRSVSADDVARYVSLGGAPADGAWPEPLIGALFSYLLGVKLPGPGTNYLKQSVEFLEQAPMNEPLTARVEITRLRPEKNLVDLETTCRLANGRVVARGRALVYVADIRPRLR